MGRIKNSAARREQIFPWAQEVERELKRNSPMWGSQLGNGVFAEPWKDSKRKRRNLQVVYGKVTNPSVGVEEVLVYGGAWYDTDGAEYPLYDTATTSNKTSYFDYVSVTWSGYGSGTYNLIIARDESNQRCTLHVEPVGAYVGTYENYVILATFTLNADGAVSTQLQENWKGGNIHTSSYDGISINKNSGGKFQIYEWENASTTTATPVDTSLFPFQDASGDLRYSALSDITASVKVDGVSINKNGDEIQLYNWASVSGGAGTPSSAALFPAKDDGATLKYYDIDDIAQYIINNYVDGKYWVLGSNYTECYGVSIGAQSGTDDTPSAAVIELVNKQLVGDWEVTGTTAAGVGVGALEVSGGIYAAEGLYVDRTTGTAGFFDSGNSTSALATGAQGGLFTYAAGFPLTSQVELATASYAVNTLFGGINVNAASAYHHGTIAGLTYTSQEIRLPLADGSYLAGYLRGGIFTAS